MLVKGDTLMDKKSVKEIIKFLQKEANTTFISENIIYQIKYNSKNKSIIIPHIYIDDEGTETFCVLRTNFKNIVIQHDSFTLKDFEPLPLYKYPRKEILYTDQINLNSFKQLFKRILNSNDVEYLIIHYKDGREVKVDWGSRRQELRNKTVMKICNLFNSIYAVTIFYGYEKIEMIEDKQKVQKIKEKMLDQNRHQIKKRNIIF